MHVNHLQTQNTQQQLPVSLLISGKSGFSRRSNMLILKPIKQWNPEIHEINFVEREVNRELKIYFASQLKIGMCHFLLITFEYFFKSNNVSFNIYHSNIFMTLILLNFRSPLTSFSGKQNIFSGNILFFSRTMTPIRICI